MSSTPTFQVIGTLLVSRKGEMVFCRQTSAFEYGVFRKAYSIYFLPSVPCVLSAYVRPLSVCGGRTPCLSVVRFLVWGGDLKYATYNNIPTNPDLAQNTQGRVYPYILAILDYVPNRVYPIIYSLHGDY